MAGQQPSRVLLAQTSFLGDLVLCTPVLAQIKHHWPAARVSVLVRPDLAPLLRHHPHVDGVLAYDKRGADRGLGGLWRTAARLRSEKFDLGIGLQRSFRTALLLALARVPDRVGFRESPGSFLYHRLATRGSAGHAADRWLRVLEPLGLALEPSKTRLLLAVGDEERSAARSILANAGLGNERYIVFAPGSVWPTKQWTAEGYGRVAAAARSWGYAAVFVGARGESGRVEEVQHAAGCGLNLAGRTDVALLAAVVEGASAVVCNDSGPLHIAQALHVPLVAIFGPTLSSGGFGPRQPPAIVVEREGLECRPCQRHGGMRCPLGTHECMRSLEPQRVVSALLSVLAGNQREAVPAC